MLFGRKKTDLEPPLEWISERGTLAPSFLQQLSRSQSTEQIAVSFKAASLGSQIKNLNYQIPSGAWLLLLGPDTLTKALFCDLAFGFIKPQVGIVSPRYNGGDVSFLGRPHTTYGVSLLDHLTSGVKERSRGLAEFVVKNIFGPNLQALVSKDSLLQFKDDKLMADHRLCERDWMEIAEANLVLQNRPAVVVDTISEFYRAALTQGFRHSELFLGSGKTIFWILQEAQELDPGAAPWLTHENKKVSLYFEPEALLTSIN